MTRNVLLLVMTDGRREMLERTLRSFRDSIGYDEISAVVVNDDSASAEYVQWLECTLPSLIEARPLVISSSRSRSGFGGAIRNAWGFISDHRGDKLKDFDWVFHLEDDFTFPQSVDLGMLREVMETHPYLVQMALRRQPWGSDSTYAGGFIEAMPEAYEEHDWSWPIANNGVLWAEWLETTRNWTTNPALYRADLLSVRWPDDPFSEGKFGFVLKESGLPWGVKGDNVRFGIWGGRGDPPRCFHIGDYRVGSGY